MTPPRSERERQVSNKQASQDRLSQPVTSMKKSVVEELTAAWFPFIIGGNDNTFSFESIIIGYFEYPSTRWA